MDNPVRERRSISHRPAEVTLPTGIIFLDDCGTWGLEMDTRRIQDLSEVEGELSDVLAEMDPVTVNGISGYGEIGVGGDPDDDLGGVLGIFYTEGRSQDLLDDAGQIVQFDGEKVSQIDDGDLSVGPHAGEAVIMTAEYKPHPDVTYAKLGI